MEEAASKFIPKPVDSNVLRCVEEEELPEANDRLIRDEIDEYKKKLENIPGTAMQQNLKISKKILTIQLFL